MVKLKDSDLILANGEVNLQDWVKRVSAFRTEKECDLILKACELVQSEGLASLTPFGESCFHQGLMMADILHDLGLDTPTIAASIVYATLHYSKISERLILSTLGEPVAHLIFGTLRMHSVHANRQIQQTENLRRLLLAVVEDVRMVLIRLAEHTCDMRAAVKLGDNLRYKLAIETQEIYAPLANRLGIGQLKWELEDLAFRFLEPEAYKHIAKLLHERRILREQYIDKAVQQIKQALKAENVQADVFGRVKHIYSIWKKMNRKGVSYHEIYDVRAVRILVPNVRDCYAALGVVHSLWQHIPKEFDDYIANPKDNGYRSLHTAVIGPEDKTLEIQIRTNEMHDQAELGIAAHWRYKEGGERDSHYEIKLINLRQILRWQEEWSSQEENEVLKAEVFQERVYVLTPKGKVLDLALGATVLDFAYQVHTEIGNRCRGAKVNGRIVPLTYTLKSGDQVEIITAKTGGPSRDWLNPQFGYIKTVRARAKAHQWFKRQDRDHNIVEGREVLDRELKRLGVENIRFEQLAQQLKFQKAEDMFAAMGAGDIRLPQILGAIHAIMPPFLEKIQSEAPLPLHKTTQPLPQAEILVLGLGNLLCQMARCCKPIPGDSIIGYVRPGRGISIHRKDCLNILQVNEQKAARLIPVEWGSKTENQYKVDVCIAANDRRGLLRDISAILASEFVNVLSIHSVVDKSSSSVDFHFKLEITDITQLAKVFTRIQQIPNVLDIRRVQS